MGTLKECLKVISVNVQGLKDHKKNIDVLQYLKKQNPHIVCLQDTHWVNSDQDKIKKNMGW